MSVISKDLSEQIAYKLTEKSRMAMEKVHVAYRELVTTLYEKATPKAVKSCYKNNPEWFHRRSQITFEGFGFRWEQISSTRPVIQNTVSYAKLQLTSELASEVMAAKRKYEKANEKYKELKMETAQALRTLKTYANIRKELPEAASFLPPPISNALVVNFTGLKKTLAEQPGNILEKTT